MALTTKRIIALPSQTDPQEGDYLAIDNATSGTHKIPVGRIGVEVDDTLTEAGKAADAKAVGDALDEIRSQIEVTGTASGAIATFTDGSAMPAKSVIVNIEPQQSGTGTPSPENVRPISGWESVNIDVAGGNLIDVSTNQSGVIDANGNEAENSVFNRTDFIPIDKAKIYVKTSAASGYAIRVHGYSSSKAWVQQLKLITTTGTELLVGETVPDNIAYVRLSYPVVGVDNTELWQGDTTPINLGRTVYGGTLDVVSGVLTVDRAMVDLGTLDWSTPTASGRCSASLGAKPPTSSTDLSNLICSDYETITARQWYDASKEGVAICGAGYGTNGNIGIVDSRFIGLTSAEVKSLLDGSKAVYPLATPQTYQLTPTKINTLLGDNNVWADSGDVEVVYIRDLNIAINNLLNNNGTRSLGMMAMSAPTEGTAEEPTDEPAEDDMR